MRKYDKDSFIKKVNSIHGDIFDLSDFEYINSITPSKCVCKICGNVWYPRPDVLLRGCGCRKCHDKKISDNKKIDFNVIINKIKEYNSNIEIEKESYIDVKHKCKATCSSCGYCWTPIVGDLVYKHSGCPKCKGQIFDEISTLDILNDINNKKYNNLYQLISVYRDGKVNYAKFICPKHGEMIRDVNLFKSGNACHQCIIEKTKLDKKERLLCQLKEKYPTLDFSKSEFNNLTDIITVICPKHGEFKKQVRKLLYGCGCGQCAIEERLNKVKISVEEWKERCTLKHDGKYDYSKALYRYISDDVVVVCKEHGEFVTSAKNHLYGGGICPKCNKRHKLTTEEFIEKAKQIHGNIYDYSKVEYNRYNQKVCIICPTHGEFLQTPNDHLDGCGCPICKQSHLENDVMKMLVDNNIQFERQKKFDWLGCLSLDFYLSQYNIAIECQGEQHFKPIEHFGGEEAFIKQIERDCLKNKLCNENHIKLIYYIGGLNINNLDNSLFFNETKNLIENIVL